MNILNLVCVALSAYVAGDLFNKIQYSKWLAFLYAMNLLGMLMNMIVLYPLVRV